MKSDEILAETLATYFEGCPEDLECSAYRETSVRYCGEKQVAILTCKQCWLDWARKKAEEEK